MYRYRSQLHAVSRSRVLGLWSEPPVLRGRLPWLGCSYRGNYNERFIWRPIPLKLPPFPLPSLTLLLCTRTRRAEFKRCQTAAKNVATNRQLFRFVALTRGGGLGEYVMECTIYDILDVYREKSVVHF